MSDKKTGYCVEVHFKKDLQEKDHHRQYMCTGWPEYFTAADKPMMRLTLSADQSILIPLDNVVLMDVYRVKEGC